MDTRVRDELGGGEEKKKKKGQSHDVGAILFKTRHRDSNCNFPEILPAKT